MELLRAQAHQGASVILVLHDLTLASRFCDRLLLLHEGRTVAAGAVETVLNADHLRLAYGIGVVTGKHQGQSYIVPWSCEALG